MGKVYDALRRAEEQRAQRVEQSGEAAALAATAEGIAPPAPPAAKPAKGRSLLDGLRAARKPAARGGDVNRRRVALLQPDSAVAEQFRTLRARLDAVATQRPLRTLAVTSARAGDGKTLAAISLAAVTAMQAGRSALLIDCDLRHPAVAESLGLRVDAGLAEVLAGQASLQDATHAVEGNDLHVVPVRSQPGNPAELLGSSAMSELLREAGERYDSVVLDLPPTLGVPDAKIASAYCDGVVFIVRADVTSSPDIDAAIEILDRDRIVGLVMNGAETVAGGYGRA